MRYEIEVDGRTRTVVLEMAASAPGTRYIVGVDERRYVVDAVLVADDMLSLLVESSGAPAGLREPSSYEVVVTPNGQPGQWAVRVGDATVAAVMTNQRRRRAAAGGDAASGPQRLLAPMPGKVVRVLAAPGDQVEARQPIVVVEAMKMENEMRAAAAGRIVEISVREGQSVEAGSLLAVIEHT